MMRRWLALALVVVMGALGGCGKSRDRKKISLERDGQAVVLIEEPEAARLVDETEPNDTIEQATVIALGAGARGSLDGEADVDMYKVTVTAPGMLAARLGGIEGVDLMLDLLDAGGTTLAQSDRGPAQTVEGIANFPVVPGDYYLAVREFVSKRAMRRRDKSGEPGRTGPSPVYELTAALITEPLPDHEREPNDSLDSAAELLIGDEALGYIGWTRDTDIWKLSVEGFTEQYSLDLDLDGVPGVSLILEILDGDGATVLRREGEKDGGLAIRNLVPVTASAGADRGHYYARLTARRSNPVDTYRLRVATRLLELDEEIEPNDRPEIATPLRDDLLATEGKRRGFLTVGDEDCYRLEAGAAPMLLTVEVVPGAEVDPVLTILSDSGTLAMADAGKRGEKEHLAAVRIPAGQSVTVKVSGRGGLGAGAAYQLVWALEPAGAAAGAPGAPIDPFDDVLGDYED
jgi:hypothetical protein